jgi:hypothetical protein
MSKLKIDGDQPLLLLLDDFQWVDESTLDFSKPSCHSEYDQWPRQLGRSGIFQPIPFHGEAIHYRGSFGVP